MFDGKLVLPFNTNLSRTYALQSCIAVRARARDQDVARIARQLCWRMAYGVTIKKNLYE